ncbi:MAG: ankyrin repeat domain-containing protein [Truepera sp.]|nr:ankyrin repeat domain-containing protein [Truepera sp.]
MSQRVKWVLVVGLLALLGQVWAADCDQWNTPGFFEVATLEEVRGCLEAGAEVNAQDEHGHTPLHGAAEYSDNPAIVALLLEAGAEVNAQDEEGITPLYTAVWESWWQQQQGRHSNPEIVALLLEAGADPNAERPRMEGWAPLHEATQSCPMNPEIITLLLEAGADVNAHDELFNTPLTYAAWRGTNPEIIILLLEAGADPHKSGARGLGRAVREGFFTAWEFINKNEALKGTEAYERLREATLGAESE